MATSKPRLSGTEYKDFNDTLKFNGKVYHIWVVYTRKSAELVKDCKSIRSRGWFARIVKRGSEYAIYIRRSKAAGKSMFNVRTHKKRKVSRKK